MPTTIEGKNFYTVLETANVLNVVPQTVRRYIESGKITPASTGKPILIKQDQIEQIAPGVFDKQPKRRFADR